MASPIDSPSPSQLLPYEYQAPPPPPQRGGVGLIVGLAAAAVVVTLCAGLGGYALATRDTPAAGSSPSPRPYVSKHGGDLRRFLLPKPAGAQPWPDPRSTTGTLNPQQDMVDWDDYGPRRQEEFSYHNFVTGALAEWNEVGALSVDIRLLRFDSPANAAGLADEDTGHMDSVDGGLVTPHNVAGVPYGSVYTYDKPTSDGRDWSFAIGVHDDVVIEMRVYQHSPQSVAVTAEFLKAQWARL